MQIKPFQAVYPNADFIASADHFFSTVKEEYSEYVKSGFFNKSSHEGFYVYQIDTSTRVYTGLIACIDIMEYLNGKVKKHENTLATKEQQQIHLLIRRQAQVKPVLLTYSKVEEIENILRKYMSEEVPFLEITFEKGEQKHTFWEVKDGERVQQIQQLFQKIPCTYIADGHHRTSATALMQQRGLGKSSNKNYDQLLCTFFPTTELEILDFNRIIEALDELSPALFMAKLSCLFDIEPLPEAQKPTRKFELTMFLDKQWYQLTWRAEVLENYKKEAVVLDVNLLNELILKNILGIQEVRTDLRVKYVEGPVGLEELKNKTLKNEQRVAFCLYPVAMEDFLAISDAGSVLPPKSTWFEPRIKNGLIVKDY